MIASYVVSHLVSRERELVVTNYAQYMIQFDANTHQTALPDNESMEKFFFIASAKTLTGNKLRAA